MSEIINSSLDAEQALAKVILEGDLGKLSPKEKVMYYKNVCDSVGLNPLTQPFEYIRFQGKERLYAGKNCTEQLRHINGISLKVVARDKFDDLYVVTAEAINKEGRCDSSTGAVNLKGLSGDALANALMKAETKAKRRVTLSIAGLGFLDESEVDSIPNAQKLSVNMETGELIEPVKQQEPANEPLRIEKPINVDNLHKTFINIKEAKNEMAAIEFCKERTQEEKKALWGLMTAAEKKWMKDITDKTPREARV